MNYKWYSATKYSICTVLCTMTHTVMSSIPSNGYFSVSFYFLHQRSLVLLPVKINRWEQLFLQNIQHYVAYKHNVPKCIAAPQIVRQTTPAGIICFTVGQYWLIMKIYRTAPPPPPSTTILERLHGKNFLTS